MQAFTPLRADDPDDETAERDPRRTLAEMSGDPELAQRQLAIDYADDV